MGKLLGQGTYSTVYVVTLVNGGTESTPYALKQFSLRNSKGVECALREQLILKRLAINNLQSLFLTSLICSFYDRGSPIFVFTKGSELDFSHLLDYSFLLGVNSKKFYGSEIFCGLEHLHLMGVVHLDIKRGNILRAHTGHILITDFDCSNDTIFRNCPPRLTDYRGNRAFKTPEMANKTSISSITDVWSFGALPARLTLGYVRFPKVSRAEMNNRWFWKYTKNTTVSIELLSSI